MEFIERPYLVKYEYLKDKKVSPIIDIVFAKNLIMANAQVMYTVVELNADMYKISQIVPLIWDLN